MDLQNTDYSRGEEVDSAKRIDMENRDQSQHSNMYCYSEGKQINWTKTIIKDITGEHFSELKKNIKKRANDDTGLEVQPQQLGQEKETEGRSKTATICRQHEYHTQKTKVSIKKLSELINEFNKAMGYKIHIYNSVAFLYRIINYHKEKRERCLRHLWEKVKDR